MERSITTNLDGTITLVNGDRTKTLAKGVKDKDAQIAAFLPPEVPASVTPLQMRKALRAAGLKPAVEAFVAALDEDEAVEEWEYALAIERGNPMLSNAAKQLGMTEAQVDGLFILAATMT